jgi:hypothetical protein
MMCPEVDLLLKNMREYGSALPEDFAGAWRIRSAIAVEQSDSAQGRFCSIAGPANC